jgi:hypothetical protein
MRSFVFNKLLLGSRACWVTCISLITSWISVGGPRGTLPLGIRERSPGAGAILYFQSLVGIPGFRAGYILLISKPISANGGKAQVRSQVRTSLEIYNVTCFQLLVRFGRQKINNLLAPVNCLRREEVILQSCARAQRQASARHLAKCRPRLAGSALQSFPPATLVP